MFWCFHWLNYACFLVFFVYDVTWFLTFILFTRGAVEDIRLEAKIKAKDTKKIRGQKAKDSPSENRPFRGQGQEWSRPRPRTKGYRRYCSPKKKKKKVFKIFFQAISSKKSSLKFFLRRFSNFNNSKNAAVLKPRTGQFLMT